MNIAGLYTGPEKRTQFLIRDDGKLWFRQLPIQDTFMVVKSGDDVKQGWLHYHNNQFDFPGFKNIHADMVTICTNRDILLDDFNIIKPEDKPAAGTVHLGTPGMVKQRIKEIADSVRHKKQVKPGNSATINRVNMFLGCTLIIMVLALGIQYATRSF